MKKMMVTLLLVAFVVGTCVMVNAEPRKVIPKCATCGVECYLLGEVVDGDGVYYTTKVHEDHFDYYYVVVTECRYRCLVCGDEFSDYSHQWYFLSCGVDNGG